MEVSCMVGGMGRGWRWLVASFAVALVVASAPQGALADKSTNPDEFTVSGTIDSHHDDKTSIVLVTDALGKKNQPITIDMKYFPHIYNNLGDHQPVSLLIIPRESNSYLMTGYVSEGSYVHSDDLGVQERYETRSDSIKAHVGNVPEDDESLNQQHRDNDLKTHQDDDDLNGNNCCESDT
jgi:hypothetical protein